jgi:FtsZ-interacting cell division protein ZipA
MDESTIAIIVIVIAAVLLIGLAVWALRRRRAAHDAEALRYENERREKAREHRDLAAVTEAEARQAEVEADARAVQARQAEVEADARAVEARQEQLRAEEARFEAERIREEARTVNRQADELDPDVDNGTRDHGVDPDATHRGSVSYDDTAGPGDEGPSGPMPRKGPAPRT